ncbi:MAG: NAD-binding protein [Dermatophilaceae bacterium]
MANLLMLLLIRSSDKRRASRRRIVEGLPREAPSTDAIFIVLRRIRFPLVVFVCVFAVATFGMSMMPGQDEAGNATRLSPFDSFYFIMYTATTIGYGEIVPLTTPQRMWLTATIFALVVCWAVMIATTVSMLQDEMFLEAWATQRFRRKVARLNEGFVILTGYGQTGKQVAQELDRVGRRLVVLDHQQRRIDRLGVDQLHADAPGLAADAAQPGVLGLAGLGSKHCGGILALTNDDDTNLAVVMAARLLRPELPVIARCHHRGTIDRMRDFGAEAVINPSDRYGTYLVLALHQPQTYRLVTWLMAGPGVPLPGSPAYLADGSWVVAADGDFADEVSADLRSAGLTVDVVDPRRGHPVVGDAVGFVAGTDSDTFNLALAEHARLQREDLFVVIRQKSSGNRALIEALGVDATYIPTDVVANEALARVITPVFWSFVEYAALQEERWSEELLHRIVERCGTYGPHRMVVTIDARRAPAIHRWLARQRITLAELLREPDDRDATLRIVPLLLVRDGETTFAPDEDMELRRGDQILCAGRRSSLGLLHQNLDYDSVVEYLVTGRDVPDTFLWRVMSGRRTTPYEANKATRRSR